MCELMLGPKATVALPRKSTVRGINGILPCLAVSPALRALPTNRFAAAFDNRSDTRVFLGIRSVSPARAIRTKQGKKTRSQLFPYCDSAGKFVSKRICFSAYAEHMQGCAPRRRPFRVLRREAKGSVSLTNTFSTMRSPTSWSNNAFRAQWGSKVSGRKDSWHVVVRFSV